MYAWLHGNSSVIFDAAGDGYVAITAAVGADCWLSPARAFPDRGCDEDDRAPELAQDALHVEGDERVVLDQGQRPRRPNPRRRPYQQDQGPTKLALMLPAT